MIIPNINKDMIISAVDRICFKLGIRRVENKSMFTLEKAFEEDDDVWFDRSAMDEDDFEDFIKLVGNYYDLNVLDRSKHILKIDCPHCHNSNMTIKQQQINNVIINNNENQPNIIICNNCAEIIRI